MRADRINQKIKQAFSDFEQLEIVDESHQHAGRQGQESHFKILLVSPSFDGLNRVQRQRRLNQLLNDELESGLHALSMRLLTPTEFAQQNSSFQTPNCQGSKNN